jgi:ribonuclease HI
VIKDFLTEKTFYLQVFLFKMNEKETESILIYTDGSCNTKLCIGGWASIILIGEEKHILYGTENNTTNNRMELFAVLESLAFIQEKAMLLSVIKIISDSQYVIELQGRKEKFLKSNFKTKKGEDIRNIDLIKELFRYNELMEIKFEKIKAHQKKTETENFNIEADILARQIVRKAVKNLE